MEPIEVWIGSRYRMKITKDLLHTQIKIPNEYKLGERISYKIYDWRQKRIASDGIPILLEN